MELISTPKQYVDAVEQAAASIGKLVTLRGTVHRVRDMSDFAFVVVRVNRGLIQCMMKGEVSGYTKADVKDGMVVEISGTVHEEPRAEHGFEIVLESVKVLAKPAEQLPVPLGKKYMGLKLDVDLPLRPITLRHPNKQAVFRVQGALPIFTRRKS